MNPRSAMIQRCDIERKVESGTGDYGSPVYTWQLVGVGVACRFWYESGSGGRIQRNEGSTITIHAVKGIVSKKADLKEGDRIARVYNRKAIPDELFGALRLDAVEYRSNHMSVIAEEIH